MVWISTLEGKLDSTLENLRLLILFNKQETVTWSVIPLTRYFVCLCNTEPLPVERKTLPTNFLCAQRGDNL